MFKDRIVTENLEVLSARKAERFYTGRIIDRRLSYVDIYSIFAKPELDDARKHIYSEPNNFFKEIITNSEYFDYAVSIAIEIGKVNIENGIRMLNNLGTGIRNYLDHRYDIIDSKFELAQKLMAKKHIIPQES